MRVEVATLPGGEICFQSWRIKASPSAAAQWGPVARMFGMCMQHACACYQGMIWYFPETRFVRCDEFADDD